jgi:methionine biosynthesis protein MetW
MTARATNETPSRRCQDDLIVELVEPGARVLDLGCGTGELLRRLKREKQIHGRGVEIEPDNILRCIERGLAVIQGNLDEGLAEFGNHTYDWVILSQTLQVVHKPALVLREMLRVGRRGIVSFPNFGYWRVRLQLALSGRMPKTRALPYSWHESPNIHQLTIADFRAFCREANAQILEEIPIAGGRAHRGWPWANLLAEEALFVLTARKPPTEAQAAGETWRTPDKAG